MIESQFIKDEVSGVIINTSESDFQKFKSARAQAKKTKDVLTRITSIEMELKEIKNLLIKALGDRIK